MSSLAPIGSPATRIDGVAKVTGGATYAAEAAGPGLAHGHVVSSVVAKGHIARLNARAALVLDGVLAVLTHENRVKMSRSDAAYQDEASPDGSPFRPLYDGRIRYAGQPVALVVAETPEIARHAASLLRIDYAVEPHVTELDRRRGRSREVRRTMLRGNPDRAFAEAAIRCEAEYRSPIEHHNPIEPHAATVIWEGDGRLTVHDKTQGVQNSRDYIVGVFGLAPEKVRVLSPFVGGAFGSGLRPQYHLALAVMAALALERSVRVALTRKQMFTFGYRPETIQRVSLGAKADGTLVSITNDTVAVTSRFEAHREPVAHWAGLLYRCPNTRFRHKLARLDLCSPADMRAPGGALGLYALESAIDELAVAAAIDPLALRLKNYSERDQNHGRPYSTKQLRACYLEGAERFGWSGRSLAPRSMRDGNELVGWGMATGIWEALQETTSARAVLNADGKLEVSSATADIGTGTYTIMAQIGAGMLGLGLADVSVRLGDSTLPDSPIEGGSWMAASVGGAIHRACQAVQKELLRLARRMPDSPFVGVKPGAVEFADRAMRLRDDPSVAVPIRAIMRAAGTAEIVKDATAELKTGDGKARYTHAAVFAEVRVDAGLGVVRVTRVVDAVAAGRIVNPVTARSQVIGGVVWGIGMALHEETLIDHVLGRIMNANLADYHLPAHADVGEIDVIFVDEPGETMNPLGIKGVGEIGIVGTAAAIANAVFHATGKRIRDLPITIDKLLD